MIRHGRGKTLLFYAISLTCQGEKKPILCPWLEKWTVKMDEQTIQTAPVDVGPENTKLINAFTDAVIAADDEEAARLAKLILFRPESLMAIKIARGAAHIRERSYRTDLADRKYGHGWLDQ